MAIAAARDESRIQIDHLAVGISACDEIFVIIKMKILCAPRDGVLIGHYQIRKHAPPLPLKVWKFRLSFVS
jgi:hypothetical protein